jgi:hypothetical protein
VNTAITTYALAYYLDLLHATTTSAILFNTGLFALAFTVLPMMNHNNFAHGVDASLTITVIDGLYELVALVAAGLIMAYWK